MIDLAARIKASNARRPKGFDKPGTDWYYMDQAAIFALRLSKFKIVSPELGSFGEWELLVRRSLTPTI
jgi:hypothetical protein